ncbi:MAG: hypothetical protein CL582_17780 [Alteromonadaceae bacterium]|nr:hypothetical protein [Alteromonadaceae bacterium]
MCTRDELSKYNFQNIFANISNVNNFIVHLKGEEPTKESVEAGEYREPWVEVIDMHPSELGVGVGYCVKFEDELGRLGIVLATSIGNVVLDQRFPGHDIIRVTAPAVLKNMFHLSNPSVSEYKLLFGEALGKKNRHVLDVRINNLIRAVENRKQQLKELDPQQSLL